MATGKFVPYYRVSTDRQGEFGLGLEAQQSAVLTYLNSGNWHVIGDANGQPFIEIETSKKDDQERPVLAAALAACRLHDAKLLVAKLDRLARNVHFISGLMQSGVEFVCVEMLLWCMDAQKCHRRKLMITMLYAENDFASYSHLDQNSQRLTG
jgi:DNA invertase Pin-like site-specific DNA recombinase